jgi:hypothetical protein
MLLAPGYYDEATGVSGLTSGLVPIDIFLVDFYARLEALVPPSYLLNYCYRNKW